MTSRTLKPVASQRILPWLPDLRRPLREDLPRRYGRRADFRDPRVMSYQYTGNVVREQGAESREREAAVCGQRSAVSRQEAGSRGEGFVVGGCGRDPIVHGTV